MNSLKDSDPYGLRDRKGKWVRKGVGKIKVALGLALVGTFLYCAPASWKHDQGSKEYDQGVIDSFVNGNCKHIETLEGVHGPDVECSYADKDLLRKWSESMEKQIEFWKQKAGEPTAILTRVCKNQGVLDTDCPKILYAMAVWESRFGKTMSGDGGLSHGFFHIMWYHEVPKSCSEDLECSADWTLKRMIGNGFKKNRDNAIRLHNGGLDNPVTLTYLQNIKKSMAFWPE